MVRLNITMPEDLVQQLKHIRNKSKFIAQALREKFQRDKKKELENLLIEGYQKSTEEDKIINKEWEAITLEDVDENQ